MKKILLAILALLLVAGIIMAANPFPATLTVKNQTDGNVIISMEYPYSFLVVKPGTTSKFTIERGVYSGVVTACGKTTSGTMNLEHNLKLNFTPCAAWGNTSAPKYPGEPTLEKPNWNRRPGVADWRFDY
jgi:hypothetical protein